MRPDRRVLAAMAGVSMALLMLEIATTRILSVAMAYHFAVLSISLAMMGLAIGGVIVHTAPAFVAAHGPTALAGRAALLFGLSTTIATFCLLGLPIQPLPGFAGFMNLVLLFVPQSIPYVLAGTATALLLYAYPDFASHVYAADLLGAGLGCLAVAVCLPRVGGPATILVAAAIAGLSGGLLIAGDGHRATVRRSWLWALLLAIVALGGCLTPVFEMRFVKGAPEPRSVKIVWTAYSRLHFSLEHAGSMPFGWGFGTRFTPRDAPYRYGVIRIDGMAETPIVRWVPGDPGVEHVLWDVTSVPYHLKKAGRAMVIGSGGGRDILSARLSGAWNVDAVEINDGIVREMEGTFAAYSGHVYSLPGVHATALDGRSAMERAQDGTYDVIQMSAVDTWAAGSSGALALMENGLYTVEAFSTALRKLRPDGYLAVSRFKYPNDFYGESVRMVALALEALRRGGAREPASHILLVSNVSSSSSYVVTMLVRPTPFTAGEVERARLTAQHRGFTVEWPRDGAAGPPSPAVQLLQLPTPAERDRFFARYPIDVRPTWDDRPYFFHQARLASLGNIRPDLDLASALRLVPMLTILRLAVFLLVASVVIVAAPVVTRRDGNRPTPRASLVFFAAIGAGFMLYEIPLVQKLTLALGHPTHALTVVLFGLLVGTGCGSYLSGLAPARILRPLHLLAGAVASGTGLALALGTDPLVAALFRLATIPRTAAAFGVVAFTGSILGTMLPIGLRRLAAADERWAIPWCWASNGSASVLASVVALMVGVEVGMRATFFLGAAAYLCAAAAATLGRWGAPTPATASSRS